MKCILMIIFKDNYEYMVLVAIKDLIAGSKKLAQSYIVSVALWAFESLKILIF